MRADPPPPGEGEQGAVLHADSFKPGHYPRVNAGGLTQAWLHWRCEAVSRVRSQISPGPYRSFRELSLAGFVDPVIWCPPTFVGNSGIERSNGHRGFALYLLPAEFIPCRRCFRHSRRTLSPALAFGRRGAPTRWWPVTEECDDSKNTAPYVRYAFAIESGPAHRSTRKP